MNLRTKLTLAFVLVAVVAVGLVAVLANRATAVGFQQYLAAGETDQLAQAASQLATFYQQEGSWNGVNAVLRDSGIGPDPAGGGYFVRILDAAGNDVGGRGGGQGRNALEFEPDFALPILLNGAQIGTLLAAKSGAGGSRAGEQYLAQVNQAILWAGLIAVFLALLLGIFLARRLTRPLFQLNRATQAVAGGDLSQRVTVATHDEVGELADHFNAMTAALQTAEVQRQQLLADTAHDLRTPISIMQSHLEAMLDGVFPTTPENLGIVYEETLRLGRLVGDVRTLSLVEAGQLPLDKQAVDLTELVAQAAASFAPLAEADGIQLVTNLQPTPPVQADPTRIHQVLANLIANALRYAPQGAQTPPTVSLTVSAQDEQVKVQITDNGPGLTPEQQASVFDRFWRSDAARSREQGGSGLGLAIAKGIVAAHGGTIGVESEPGQGATFWFTLPNG
ncbi:MAG: HAMP domain-containing histidine kinase [Anaerolineae bacterium]|nr:HAMP domain-containing histidine kinase [Anaerolineae bacterium]